MFKCRECQDLTFCRNCRPFRFEVIFISAYDRYAIKAIKFSALDYLLKPIDVDELVPRRSTCQRSRREERKQLSGPIRPSQSTVQQGTNAAAWRCPVWMVSIFSVSRMLFFVNLKEVTQPYSSPTVLKRLYPETERF